MTTACIVANQVSGHNLSTQIGCMRRNLVDVDLREGTGGGNVAFITIRLPSADFMEQICCGFSPKKL